MTTETVNPSAEQPTPPPLSPRERRVIAVLVEKAKTTPDVYPMTLAAITTGCNQKSNRDPVTDYDQDDVEETLQILRKKGLTIMVDAGGRALRWKHMLYEVLKVTKGELSVLVELLLRGPQTEGDLRARASRMEPLPDLTSLQAILAALASRRLVHYLSPREQKRGVFVAHGLYPAEELEKVRQAFASRVPSDDEMPASLSAARTELNSAATAPGWMTEMAGLRGEIASIREENTALRGDLNNLRTALQALAAEVRALKSELGA
jgi:uncharacterized protein YceH (UPF0502 family)